MPDLITQHTFTDDANLKEGEIAMVFQEDGGIRLSHNIQAIRDTGLIPVEHRATFLMALGAMEVAHDEEAMASAMKRAVSMFSQLEAPSPQSVRN